MKGVARGRRASVLRRLPMFLAHDVSGILHSSFIAQNIAQDQILYAMENTHALIRGEMLAL